MGKHCRFFCRSSSPWFQTSDSSHSRRIHPQLTPGDSMGEIPWALAGLGGFQGGPSLHPQRGLLAGRRHLHLGTQDLRPGKSWILWLERWVLQTTYIHITYNVYKIYIYILNTHFYTNILYIYNHEWSLNSRDMDHFSEMWQMDQIWKNCRRKGGVHFIGPPSLDHVLFKQLFSHPFRKCWYMLIHVGSSPNYR